MYISCFYFICTYFFHFFNRIVTIYYVFINYLLFFMFLYKFLGYNLNNSRFILLIYYSKLYFLIYNILFVIVSLFYYAFMSF